MVWRMRSSSSSSSEKERETRFENVRDCKILLPDFSNEDDTLRRRVRSDHFYSNQYIPRPWHKFFQ